MAISKVILNGTTLMDVTQDTVTADKLLQTYTATKNDGTKVNGSVAQKSAQTYIPTTTDQTISSGQYLTGVQTIKGDANLLAENIKKDVVIFGITGTYEGDTPSGYTVTVSLTNPQNSRYFSSCVIMEGLSDDPYDYGQQLGQINSATGSAEVMVSSSLYGIIVIIYGASVGIDSSGISCTGGVAYSSNTDDTAVFSVTGNGTATIDGVDYDY